MTAEHVEFETARLRVGPWHVVAGAHGFDLPATIAAMMTESATSALPEAWHGSFDRPRATAWIDERDRESPTMLAVERASGEPAALLFAHEVAIDESTVDLRLGYVVAAAARGRGIATELVGGLVEWATDRGSISRVTAGVAATNPASIRVLAKNGFQRIDRSSVDGDLLYRLDVAPNAGIDRGRRPA